MKQLRYRSVSLGCDPEFFFASDGKVIGAEKVISEDGLKYTANYASEGETPLGRIIIDGVQAEFNPHPWSCRANLANELHDCFKKLYEKIKDDPKLSVKFDAMVVISKQELNSLSWQARRFGCAPSTNAYTKKESSIKVDASKYRFRSAGGHIHIGGYIKNSKYEISTLLRKPGLLVPLLDIIVGNTCVLMDRNPYAAERRKVYGRAGEYRLPKHGLEYRTLSNFWLRSYQLMSLVFGLVRLSVVIGCNILTDEHVPIGNDGQQQLIKSRSEFRKIFRLVKRKDIIKAINENDYDLALSNYLKIRDFLMEIIPASEVGSNDHYPIYPKNIKDFDYFLSKGIDYWFTNDPLHHWMHIPECHGTGWENFSETVVRRERQEEERKLGRGLRSVEEVLMSGVSNE